MSYECGDLASYLGTCSRMLGVASSYRQAESMVQTQKEAGSVLLCSKPDVLAVADPVQPSHCCCCDPDSLLPDRCRLESVGC